MNGAEVLQALKDVKSCLDGIVPQAERSWTADTTCPILVVECYQNLMKYTGKMIAALGEVNLTEVD